MPQEYKISRTRQEKLHRKWKYFPRILFSLIYVLIYVGCLASAQATATTWRPIIPGIEFVDINASSLTPWSHIYVFRIDLNKKQLALLTAADLAQKQASIETYAKYSKALLAINGGFFDQNYRPLGLRIYDQKEKSPLKNISWWGIFYIENNKAQLKSLRDFKSNKQIEFAIQSGPRLLIDGKIPTLKPGAAERSALGIAEDGKVLLLVTQNFPMSTTELAHFMQSLHCVHALNLDGGSSSQLYANMENFQLQVQGFSNIVDAVIVKEKVPGV